MGEMTVRILRPSADGFRMTAFHIVSSLLSNVILSEAKNFIYMGC